MTRRGLGVAFLVSVLVTVGTLAVLLMRQDVPEGRAGRGARPGRRAVPVAVRQAREGGAPPPGGRLLPARVRRRRRADQPQQAGPLLGRR